MTARRIDGDEARASVQVALLPASAFALFTQEVDSWWRRGRRFRHAEGRSGLVCIEPGVGGRVFESYGTGSGEHVLEMGCVQVWQPPHRLVLAWRNSNFAAYESTEVEVLFDAVGAGTRVTVIHRGWAAIRADHPTRHGLAVDAFLRMMGLWWGDQLTSLRLLAVNIPARN
jgi:Activator of Hsp90 ATPase homolog 1-like protein